MKRFPIILFILSTLIILFIVGFNVGTHNVKTQYVTVINTDTITVIDTVRIEKLVPKYITKTKEKVDTVLKYIIKKDTLSIPMSLPIIEKEYSDSNYKAVVKGVEFGSYPLLKSLEIYQVTNTITNTITVRENAKKWGLNVNAGIGLSYDLYNHKIVPTVGVQIGWGYKIK